MLTKEHIIAALGQVYWKANLMIPAEDSDDYEGLEFEGTYEEFVQSVLAQLEPPIQAVATGNLVQAVEMLNEAGWDGQACLEYLTKTVYVAQKIARGDG